jgi:hypothetical protein
MARCNPAPLRGKRHVASDTTSDVIEPMTAWIWCTGIDIFRARFWATTPGSSFRGKVAYQTATARIDTPNAWYGVGAYIGPGTSVPVGTGAPGSIQDVNVIAGGAGPTTKAGYWIRFGVLYNSATGGTMAQADVELEISFACYGEHLVTKQLVLNSRSTTDDNVLLSPVFSAAGISKLKVAIVPVSQDSHARWRPVYRTGTYDRNILGSWTSLLAASTWYSGSTPTNTDEVAVSTSDAFAQVGLGFSSDTAGSQARATLIVHAAVRRA